MCSSHVEVTLVLFNFDGDCCDVVIDFAVARNFTGQAPVVCVSHSLLQDLEVAPWSCEHIPEPARQHLERGVDTEVG
jgi:hypothetical protein